jgi:4-hydroxy-3-methylbut-2-en-1-yl diphosphate reductase
MPTRLILARPRGYCAGVERAVDTVERMLELHGPPIYVRKQIVHNLHVVRRLEERGAVFVESEEDVPAGARVVLSAHGVAPTVYANAEARRLEVVDATCPLVTKVHKEARRFAERGYRVFLVGHEGHEEVVGTMGEAPDAIRLVQSVGDVDGLEAPDPEHVAYVTQTTLSVDETAEIVAALRARFPAIIGPPREDICYATTNRQLAVKSLAREVDLMLVIGSANSSNSQRLVDVTRAMGVAAHLIDDESAIDLAWLDGVETVGVTSGASAPEWLVERLVDWFRERGVQEVDEHDLISENVHFALPRGVSA